MGLVSYCFERFKGGSEDGVEGMGGEGAIEFLRTCEFSKERGMVLLSLVSESSLSANWSKSWTRTLSWKPLRSHAVGI
jgi:hypothetical protein